MMTVGRRLLLFLLPALAILMFVGGVVDYLIAATTTRRAYDESLTAAALVLAAYLRSDHGRIVMTLPPTDGRPMSSLAWRPDRQLFSIIDTSGTFIAGNARLPIDRVSRALGQSTYRDDDSSGQKLRVATVTTPSDIGPVTIAVAETLQRRRSAERVMLFGKLMVDFGELDMMLLLIWAAVYVGLRPLRQLHDQVEASTPRGLQRFDDSRVPGEVRPLVRAFNRLLELLHDAAIAQRRFIADAAHQMRTPVAGIMAQLELLLQHPAAAPVKPELTQIDRAIARLAHSANQLLALARAETLSTQELQFNGVPLRPLIEELVARNVDRADKQGLDLGADAQDAEVSGNTWLLDDMISNLIDNALKYTPRGGHVTVRCGCRPDGRAYVMVDDDGPGIPETERARVRERFYRRPGSAAIGCGLGLAIVDEIARAHRAEFSIENPESAQGTRMQVTFARAENLAAP